MESSQNEKGSSSVGSSSKGKEFANVVDLDSDEFSPSDTDIDDEQVVKQTSLQELGEDFLNKFCKEASRSFFEEFGLISHQLNSYNDFISNLSKIFKSFGEFIVEPGFDPSKKKEGDDWRFASIKFGEITLVRPSFWGGLEREKEHNMLPRHARLQNLTYSAKMKGIVRIEVFTRRGLNSDKFKTGKEHYIEKKVISTVEKEVIIGKLPVMVKSDLCWMKEVEKEDCEFDLGGYFLIKGVEKVFIAQEQICKNRLWLSRYEDLTITYQSEAGRRNRLSIKLVPLFDRKSKGEGKILTVYFLSAEIPLWVLFFALGVSSDKEVVDLIDFNSQDARVTNIIFNSIHYADKKCSGLYATKVALRFMEKMIKEETNFPPEESVEECLRIYLFPDMKGLKRKARFLGYMVKCLFEAFTGRRKCTNKDDFKNKRIEMAGELLERELRSHIAHARKRMTKALQRDLYSDKGLKAIEYYFDASIITNGLSRAFSTGAWCHPYKRTKRISGVVATLGRTNPLQTAIELRRTRQQVNYSGKVGDARFPHPSHWGKVCFLSTPDGENCGLVKNMAATGFLSTTGPEPEYLISKLKRCGMEILADDTKTPLFGKVKVFLNGAWVGLCDDSLTFVEKLRKFRRNKRLPYQIEIKRDEHHGEVRIFSDAGRILRPLLVVENLGKLNPSNGDNYNFRSLIHKGILELIGTEEEEDCSTAWGIKFLFLDTKAKYTHCELDLSFLLGMNAGIIPFANHDHAKRVLYQSQKHCQQAIGFSSTNPNIRVDTLSHQLHYPQRPLFRTMTSDCLGKQGHVLSHKGFISKSEYYNGQNAIVAVNVHMGYNQEDSLVMNRASLDRGMFRSEHIRSYKADVDNKESSDKRQKPEDCTHFGKIASRIGRTDNLDEDGFPPVGASLQTGDIIIGRGADSGADHSVKLKHTEKGMVQKVVLSSNDEGKNFAVVSLRQVRTPILGDKFSSMHGQKGVVGYLECQENFCFTKQGIVPDIVINPHAFPSRQTPGQLLEAALGKGIAMAGNGVVKDATPFSTPSCEAITDQLHRAGFTRWGNERMYDGRTGEFLKSLIFIGPTFYQRLIHMAEDKVKFRNTGPVHPMTRQPVADRKRYGGVKFGEMERDCLLAHGASANLYERLFTLSDSSEMYICQRCNNIANVIQRAVSGAGINRIRGPYCRICKSGDDIVRVQVPHGAKLLSQELFAMGINLKFETKIC